MEADPDSDKCVGEEVDMARINLDHLTAEQRELVSRLHSLRTTTISDA